MRIIDIFLRASCDQVITKPAFFRILITFFPISIVWLIKFSQILLQRVIAEHRLNTAQSGLRNKFGIEAVYRCALEIGKIGDAPILVDRPIPSPSGGQVRIRVAATALNFADLMMNEGRYQDMPSFPLVPGLEVAGVVDAVGQNVTGVLPGARVAAQCGHGGLAEYVVTDAARILPLPDAMDDRTGAAFQIAYGTSHLALARRGRLLNGETLVVLEAAGGVGLTAVEVGKALGARVIAVARGEDRLSVAKRAVQTC